ncbi:MAG: trypsin-like peptidase domain-containing protein [Eubacteriales bacterium]|nr:trypsin-like peptidase domain-containing protein [Eubacteriales bacterium]
MAEERFENSGEHSGGNNRFVMPGDLGSNLNDPDPETAAENRDESGMNTAAGPAYDVGAENRGGSSMNSAAGPVYDSAKQSATDPYVSDPYKAAGEDASGSYTPDSYKTAGKDAAGETDSPGRTDAAGSAGTDAGPAGSAAGGRYYSYGTDRGTSSSRTSGPVPGRKKDREKPGKWIALALAVVLVFVLGAGAGAYISGRTATAVLSEESEKSRAAGGSDAKTEAAEKSGQTEEKETADSGDPGTDSAPSQNTISRVEDSEMSLADSSVADVAEKVMPAIVSVYNKFTEQGQFFGRTYTQEGESAGSGIIIEETDGELLIVTNNHVVEGADSLSVQFIDEENCEAALKGTDASSDLAVIAVSLSDLSQETRDQIAIAELGDSDALRIGEQAIAIGNALGYGQSLTVGYISALNREITSENGITGTFIQTDAAINPGNSGGALLNSRGQVIGINSNKIGGSAVEGMGFAIPITKALPIIDSLKTQESRTKVAEEDQGVLGIYGISVTSDIASAYGLEVGAYVEEIIEGSGAAKSDLQAGDIITAVNGQTITGMEDLQNQLVYYEAGTEVTLTVQHPMEGNKYEEKEIKVTLSRRDSLPESGNERGEQSPRNQQGQSSEEEGQGFDDFFSFPFGSFGF